MDSIQQDSILYITAALCTFLAILVSYRWLVRQSAVKAKDDGHKKDAVAKETEETKDEEEIKTVRKMRFPIILSEIINTISYHTSVSGIRRSITLLRPSDELDIWDADMLRNFSSSKLQARHLAISIWRKRTTFE